jgi:hypothetical protein
MMVESYNKFEMFSSSYVLGYFVPNVILSLILADLLSLVVFRQLQSETKGKGIAKERMIGLSYRKLGA